MGELVAHLEQVVGDLEGVRWAAVNQATGRLVFGYDEGSIGLDALVETVEDAEIACGLTDEGFPPDRPEHPGDVEPLRRQRRPGRLHAAAAAAARAPDRPGRGPRPGGSARRDAGARRVPALVLAVAERPARSARDLDDARVARLELVGLLAMADPVRPSAAAAVAGLRSAGVEVVMVTGDHPSTAESIAAELGLLQGKGLLSGPEVDALPDEELAARVEDVAVFARVSPMQKVRIVEALQSRGRTVAMTGDGANDAAAIQLADVGVALGTRATNAAKEAADVVVTNDDIETLIHAILEGRAMWASVRDAVSVLVGGNLGEIGFTLLSELLSPRGSPLNARQLLLVNLLTDLVPAMALAMRPPRGADPSTLAREGPEASLGTALTRDVAVRGAVTAAAGGVGWTAAALTGATRSRAGTVALVSLVGSQLGQTLLAGWRDPLVVVSSLASAGTLGAVVQTPGVSRFFGCRPLSRSDGASGRPRPPAARSRPPCCTGSSTGSGPRSRPEVRRGHPPYTVPSPPGHRTPLASEPISKETAMQEVLPALALQAAGAAVAALVSALVHKPMERRVPG